MMIPHSRPTLDETDHDNVLQVMRSGHLVQGDQVARFEADLASLISVNGGIAVSSGTAALHLSLVAMGIHADDEVIVPSYVCPALLNAIHYAGAKPVITDVDEHTFNMDPLDVERRINSATKAIIVPHLFGLPANIKDIISFGIPIIEDCAQSLGSRYHGAYTGSFGDLSVFSFYATKMISTGEGGMILSNNETLLETISDLRDYDEKEIYRVRYNYKMTDMQAALGISQLKKLPSFIKKRNRIADIFNREFRNFLFTTPRTPEDRDHIHYRYVILLDHADRFIERMNEAGVACRKPVFKPLHRYLGLSGYEATSRTWDGAVSIPIYPSLTDTEITKIVEAAKTSVIRN